MAAEIASAYLALYARMPGVQGDIETQLGKVDAQGAGSRIGLGLGAGISNKQAAIAGAVGGIIASVTTVAIAGLTNLVGDAVAASDGVDKFRQTLEFAGLDTSAIEDAASQTRSYADRTVYDLTTIQNTTAQLAANGVKDYALLTEAAGNLNAVAGGNADTFGSVAMVMTQTAGAGKLTTENWNQLANAIPGAAGLLIGSLESAGAFTGNFREAMEKGEITAEEFNAAIMQVGTEPVAVEAASSTATLEGAVGNLQAVIVGGLSDAINSIKPQLTGFIDGMAGFVGFIQDNIDWIGPLAAGIGIVAVAVGIWTAVQWLLNVALTANPIGLIIVGIGLLIGAIILLVQNWDTVVAFLSDVWDGFVKWIVSVLEGFVGWWNDLWAGIFGFVTDIWNGFVGWITDGFEMFLVGLKIIGESLVDWWNGLWTGIANFVGDAFKNVSNFVVGILNTVIDLVNGAISGINDMGGLASNITGGAIGWQVDMLPKIPMLADGAIVTRSQGGTLARIGEGRYDEAVIPLGGSQFDGLADALARRMGGGGSGIQIINPDPYVAAAMLEQRMSGRVATL